MKITRLLFSLLLSTELFSCNNTTPEPGTGGSQQYPVKFDSVYHICNPRDEAVLITDTAGGIVTYKTLPDSTVHTMAAAAFIEAVENCFE